MIPPSILYYLFNKKEREKKGCLPGLSIIIYVCFIVYLLFDLKNKTSSWFFLNLIVSTFVLATLINYFNEPNSFKNGLIFKIILSILLGSGWFFALKWFWVNGEKVSPDFQAGYLFFGGLFLLVIGIWFTVLVSSFFNSDNELKETESEETIDDSVYKKNLEEKIKNFD
jgi:hypothetical protein